MKMTSPELANPELYLKLPEYFWDILKSKLNFSMYKSFWTSAFVFRVVKSKLIPDICLSEEDVAKFPKSAIAVVEVGSTLMAD